MTHYILVWGGVASVAFCIVIFASYVFTPRIWLADLTDGEQRPEPISIAILVVVLTLLIMVGGATAGAWFYTESANATFWERFVVAWGVIAVVNLVDLVFIDLVVYWLFYPPFMRIEGVPKYEKIRPHFDGFVKGVTIIGLPASALAAWIGGFAKIA